MKSTFYFRYTVMGFQGVILMYLNIGLTCFFMYHGENKG